jgi:hypothetical protein
MPTPEMPEVTPIPSPAGLRSDLACPFCTYNLRGLVEPRCPECGYAFAWTDLFQDRLVHPFLFEHHLRRNIWSFLKTLVAGLRPIRFWSTLRPSQRPNTVRLLLYWAFAMTLSFATIGASVAFVGLGRRLDDLEAERALLRRFNRPMPPASPADRAADLRKVVRARLDGIAVPAAFYLLWAGASYASLMLFCLTREQVRKQTLHILRAVVYASDCVVWTAPVAALLSFLRARADAGSRFARPLNDPAIATAAGVGCFACICWFIVRLMIAYRVYLQVHTAVGTVLLAQLTTLMLLLAGAFVLGTM